MIFDCDGVLVDSETLGNVAIAETVQGLGLPLDAEECIRLFRGIKMSEVVREIERRIGRSLDAGFVPRLRARMAELFRERLRPIEGVEDLLDRLTLPYCVASNAPMEKIELTLGVTGLLPRFAIGSIVSAYDVGVWKPDPGLYLHAAERLGVAPAGCVVVEDSVAGVEAGVAAGMRVYGFAPAGGGEELAARGATVFSAMAQLAGVLG